MKRFIQHLAYELGYEVHKRSWFGPRDRFKMMKNLGINFVLDVGANDGTYASELRQDGYTGNIWSFEPLKEVFATLNKAAAADKTWRVINCGCGASAASATINVAGNTYSSSILPMLDAHSASAPEAEYVSEESIQICSLDDSVMPSIAPDDAVWLKIDTQGYESEVLKGAVRLMPHVKALECELSLVPLYDGQLLIDDMLKMIYALGFRMVGVSPVFFEPKTGYALQIDGTFLRT